MYESDKRLPSNEQNTISWVLQRTMTNSDATAADGEVRDGTMESDEADHSNECLASEIRSKVTEGRGDRFCPEDRGSRKYKTSGGEHSSATKRRWATWAGLLESSRGELPVRARIVEIRGADPRERRRQDSYSTQHPPPTETSGKVDQYRLNSDENRNAGEPSTRRIE